jgi:F0F1-type ATP synthase membrane subunit b/b'|tara:strand:+ start:106 stop:498 length:393 start_codon:yes stop_codon:yes gene_type:complete
MPQLDTFTYLSQVTWTLFFFTVFFAIMVTHALPAISRSINVRLKKLSSGGSSQGALGDEEVSVFTSFEKLLSNSFESSRTLITKTSVSASDWVKSMTQEVNALHLTGSNVSYVKGLGSIAATTQTLTKKS